MAASVFYFKHGDIILNPYNTELIHVLNDT